MKFIQDVPLNISPTYESSLEPKPGYMSKIFPSFKRIENAAVLATLVCATSYLFLSQTIEPPKPPLVDDPTLSKVACFANVNRELTKTPKTSPITNHDIYVFGDIHGAYSGFVKNLEHAGLILKNKTWSKQAATMVQIGDVIDRGEDSLKAWNYLATLQTEARESTGEVIRILGNHELMLLEGNYRYAKKVIKDPEALAERIKEDILNHDVQLAYTDGQRLYVHAGMHPSVQKNLTEEISCLKSCKYADVTLQMLVDHLNQLLEEAVKDADYSHPIFKAGKARGGPNEYGGVLWADFNELKDLQIPQITGHNPPKVRKKASPIHISSDRCLIIADAGLYKGYGGNNAYIKIENSKNNILIHELNKTTEVWEKTDIGMTA